jgi:hypothetical protein
MLPISGPKLPLSRLNPLESIKLSGFPPTYFYADEDYRFYLERLGEAARRYRVSVHAYVLMTHHVPYGDDATSAAGTRRVLQTLGRRYVRTINPAYPPERHPVGEVGTLHGLVQGDRYLLTCYPYIELNPVRANLCTSSQNLLKAVRQATQTNRVFGAEYFQQQIEAALALRIAKRKPGPRRNESSLG